MADSLAAKTLVKVTVDITVTNTIKPTTITALDTVIAAIEEKRRVLQHLTHPHCYACGTPEVGGLGLCFISQIDGSVTADWACPVNYQSYEGILHGGIMATLLDGAMVHALFADGVVAHTAELCVCVTGIRSTSDVWSGLPHAGAKEPAHFICSPRR